MIFDAAAVEQPPDFVFGVDSGHFCPPIVSLKVCSLNVKDLYLSEETLLGLICCGSLQSLHEWRQTDEFALYNVLDELLMVLLLIGTSHPFSIGMR